MIGIRISRVPSHFLLAKVLRPRKGRPVDAKVELDGGSGVLILKGRHWAPAKEVRPTEQSSACFPP